MLRHLALIGLLLSGLCLGCLNNSDNCIPSGNCTTLPPTTATLTLNITVNVENPRVPVAVYFGDASDSLLYFVDTLSTAVQAYTVDIDTRYSAVAQYRRGALTILAIDGDRTRLTSSDDCGDTCYDVDDASMNLKLAD